MVNFTIRIRASNGREELPVIGSAKGFRLDSVVEQAGNNGIILSKTLFFIKRAVIYFIFLLFPYWTLFLEEPSFAILLLGFLPYSLFLFWQWTLISKEVEYRLKIYTRSNSSMDRILSRIILGSSAAVFYCSFLMLLPEMLREILYWVVWVSWGIWISWPTRKKILESKISNDFSEFRFLDGFEKTVFIVLLGIVFVSIPSFPLFNGLDATQLYLDPEDRIHTQFWTFVEMCYIPFQIPSKFKNLFIYFHFYFYFFSLALFSAYSVFRYIYSRRLSILGVFAFVSTWSFSLILEQNISNVFETTIAITWVWGVLWALKSFSYRSGFLIGFLNYWLVLIDYNYFLFIPVQFILVWCFLRQVKSSWYSRQFFKYTIAGNGLAFFSILTHQNINLFENSFEVITLLENFYEIIVRKSFFILSFIGALVLVLGNIFENIYKNKIKRTESLSLMFGMICIVLFGLAINPFMVTNYFAIFLFVLLSLVPLDLLFERLNQLRSRRNLIFLIYILICLLDSHLEGRVKILWENLQNL